MPCEPMPTGKPGVFAIVCSRGRGRRSGPRFKPCTVCGVGPGVRECDAPDRDVPGVTCDRALCGACAVAIAPEIDLCPEHATAELARALAPETVLPSVRREDVPMSLIVYTARVDYDGEDKLIVARRGAPPEGLAFAPSIELLAPALEIRRQHKALRDALRAAGTGAEVLIPDADKALAKLEADTWTLYVAGYRAEMRLSWREHLPYWNALLARRQVTLCCFCVISPERPFCHRVLLAKMLTKKGAVYEGERPPSSSSTKKATTKAAATTGNRGAAR